MAVKEATAAEESRPWNVTILRAINPDGSLLWPSRSSINEYRNIWESGGSGYFNAIWMQDPSGLAGKVFQPEWFQYYAHPDFVSNDGRSAANLLADGVIQKILPSGVERLLTLQASDLAISKKQTADYYARANAFVSRAGDLFIEEVFQARLSGQQMVTDIREAAARKAARLIGIESNGFQSLVFEEASKGSRLPFVPIVVDTDKVLRARPLAIRYEMGRVFHLYAARWLTAFESQLLSFPGGVHDDMVDASSLLYELLREHQPAEFGKLQELMGKVRAGSRNTLSGNLGSALR